MSAALKQMYEEKDEGELVEFNIPGFHDIRLLVDGPTRKVFKAKDDQTNEVVAIKMISIENNLLTDHVIRELLQKDLRHNNIVALKSVHLLERSLYLVMEYIRMDLEEFLLTMTASKGHLKQILEGLSFLHAHGVLHRDLKPANILVDESQKPHVVKIADFGLSRAFLTPTAPMSPHVGAWGYKAPEIILGSQHYSYPADVWAVGCILADIVRAANMMDANPLFLGSCPLEELTKIFGVFDIPTEDTWPGVSSLPGYETLISTPDLIDQPPTGLATHVPGIDPKELDLLSKMLCVCPDKRITAEAALEHDYFLTP